MKKLPDSTAAWLLTICGSVLLLLALAIHWQMILVTLDIEHVAPGGGEYMVALFAGLPTLLLACLFLGIASAKPTFRSLLSLIPFLFSIAGIVAWFFGFVLA